MRYLLDSDSLSDLYEPSSPGHRSIARRFTTLADSDLVFVSILAIYELEYGYANAPDERKPVIEGCTLIGADEIYQELQRLDPTLRIENWLVEASGLP